ncbi:MAG: DUF4263 domain-containing protein, partial [Desulfobacteraceae bacterium]|nr:DUF4263 domain-containing protein [Desulfobacteraceae bacterium]
QNVDLSGDDLQAFIDLHLNAEAIIRWVARDRSRLEPIRQLISECPELLSDVVDLSPLEDQVRALEQLSPEVLSAFFDQLLEIRDPDSLVKAFSALTESDTGRHVATDVLAGRLTERLSDARNYAHEYSTLIATEGVIETDVQNFIEEHPWLVGLHYVRVRHKVSIPRGEVDFILERYDGFYDLLELKGPEDVIIADPAPNESRQPSPPSSFSLGPSLAQALAQVHYYRHILDSSAGDVAELYGLTRTRHPRLIILIGRASDLSDTSRHLLTQLNISLHRVEIVPYDILGSRIEGLVKNVEDYLSGTGDSVT